MTIGKLIGLDKGNCGKVHLLSDSDISKILGIDWQSSGGSNPLCSALLQDFEDETIGVLPTNWSVYSSNGTYYTEVANFGGSKQFMFKVDYTTGSDVYCKRTCITTSGDFELTFDLDFQQVPVGGEVNGIWIQFAVIGTSYGFTIAFGSTSGFSSIRNNSGSYDYGSGPITYIPDQTKIRFSKSGSDGAIYYWSGGGWNLELSTNNLYQGTYGDLKIGLRSSEVTDSQDGLAYIDNLCVDGPVTGACNTLIQTFESDSVGSLPSDWTIEYSYNDYLAQVATYANSKQFRVYQHYVSYPGLIYLIRNISVSGDFELTFDLSFVQIPAEMGEGNGFGIYLFDASNKAFFLGIAGDYYTWYIDKAGGGSDGENFVTSYIPSNTRLRFSRSGSSGTIYYWDDSWIELNGTADVFQTNLTMIRLIAQTNPTNTTIDYYVDNLCID